MPDASPFQVHCNQCQAYFAPALVERPLETGGAVQEFACPHCAHLYTVAIISAKGIRLRARLAQLEAMPKRDERLVRRTKAALAREVKKPDA